MTDQNVIKSIRAAANDGELLTAIDRARAAAETAMGEELDLIRIEEVILLARIASSEEAREKYFEYGLDKLNHPDARSLWARLRKDMGFASTGAEKTRLLRLSRDGYLEICLAHDPETQRGAYEYNGVNAVSLSYALDDMAPVADVIAELSKGEPGPGYWSKATRAELLLTSDAPPDQVAEVLAAAAALPDAGVDMIASTLKQLSRIAPDHPALAALRPGPVLHFSGHMIAPPKAEYGRVLAKNSAELSRRITEKLEQISPSTVFGSLASGVDILVVEWALRTGREAVVFLPFAKNDFIEASIQPAGEDWVARAEACLSHPECTLRYLTKDNAIKDDEHAFAAVAHYAMGSAILHANHHNAGVAQLCVWDGEVTGGVAGASADRAAWLNTGQKFHEVDVSDLGAKKPATQTATAPQTDGATREPSALVFGDVKNFSKLNEDRLPAFVDKVMGAVKVALDDATARYGDKTPEFVNTWGDGVFAVFKTAAAAAYFALRLQTRMGKLDLKGLNLPPDLAIRLGLHFGVVFKRIEPVTGTNNSFGEAVARAARIEPITKEGRVFVSEEFAAELALDPAAPAAAEYVGERETAKKYGRFRLYRLRED
ncbi:MAG: adenylate/guanylate cyclase domain-containing protein [Pikeienuella sp.]